jgi:hypothetical protein
MTPRDEAILEELLSYGRDEKSTLGPMLERAELYSHHEPAERFQRPEGHASHCQCPTCFHHEMDIGSVERHEKDPPDTDRMARRAEADRRLRLVKHCNPTLARVLMAYHGDAGHKAGRTKHTRLASVTPFTEAGKRLAKLEAKKERGTKAKRTDAERVETALLVSEVQKQPQTESLINLALREAEQLYALAREAFGSTARKAG